MKQLARRKVSSLAQPNPRLDRYDVSVSQQPLVRDPVAVCAIVCMKMEFRQGDVCFWISFIFMVVYCVEANIFESE